MTNSISWSIDKAGYITLISGKGPHRRRKGVGRLPQNLLDKRGTTRGDSQIQKYVSRLAADTSEAIIGRAQGQHKPQMPSIAERLKRHLALNPDLQPITRRQYEIAVHKMVELVGDTPIDEITRQDAQEYGLKLRECGEHRNTVSRRIQCLKRLYRLAIEDYEDVYTFTNPFRKIPSQNKRPTEVNYRYVSLIEIRALITATDSTPRIQPQNRNAWKCLFALCRLAGCRRSEALRAEWRDIDFNTQMIWVGNKKTADRLVNREGMRKVPLHPLLLDLLKQRFDEVGDVQDVVVGFNRLSGNLHRTFKSICKAAGLEPWPDPYQNLRRSMVTDGHDAGVGGSDIENVFGHSVDVSRQYYLMQSAERTRELLWGPDEDFEETDDEVETPEECS